METAVRGSGRPFDGLWPYLERCGVPTPLTAKVPVAVVPAPALVPSDATSEELIRVAVRCYREACHVVGEPRKAVRYLYSRGIGGGLRRNMLAAAELFRRKSCSPLGWAVWSARQFSKFKGSGRPPATYMYAPGRVNKQRAWYQREFEPRGGLRITGPAALEAMDVLAEVRAAALTFRGPPEELAATVTGAVDLERLREALYRAGEEADGERERFDRCLRDWRWIPEWDRC